MLSYLSNCIGKCRSKYSEVKGGVPQGSVIGRLLFNIFIIDTFYMNLDCKICNFAGDTTPYSCRLSIDVVITKVGALPKDI